MRGLKITTIYLLVQCGELKIIFHNLKINDNVITSANWLHRPLKLDVISRLSLQNITTALREQPSMIIDNARHRMEPELTTRSRFIQTSLRRRYKLGNLEWRLVQQQHHYYCSTWLQHLHPHQHSQLLEWF